MTPSKIQMKTKNYHGVELELQKNGIQFFFEQKPREFYYETKFSGIKKIPRSAQEINISIK